MVKNDFESHNFAIFAGVFHNFDDFVKENAYFQQMQKWFDAQLDHKILDGLYKSQLLITSVPERGTWAISIPTKKKFIRA